ncbi:MAG TPA: response regulator transcription factor [Xanthobacteraceae bacterium]|nr:response regulator transcription factor [Xanthobacteraceae bacterium]HWW49293.1 response regulator transcription factor [Xanthobacteraceae bacterium]
MTATGDTSQAPRAPASGAERAESGAATRIILVEDNHDLRQSLADYLRLSAFDVTDVPSGVAFYQSLRGASFDIAILDVNLPDVSGFTLAGELAAERRMGIIMLTARTGRDDQIRGYAEGADLYLTKPVDSETLVLAVRNLARRIADAPVGRREQGAAAAAGIWRLDTLRQSLIAPGGAASRLTSREMMLMDHIARAGRATIPRAELVTRLGYDSRGPDNRGLDAVIHRLRQKLLEAGVELPLHVVHAVGFRFSATLTID